MTKAPAAKDPTRNVWLQLGFPDAEEHYLKAELVFRLDKAIKSLGLTQRLAARRIGTSQHRPMPSAPTAIGLCGDLSD
jgi:hypothetical protein